MAWAGGFSGVGLTRDEFRKWLRSQPKPPYHRIVNHMTDAPYTKASVPCNQRIRNLGNYYKNDLGWSGGPDFFSLGDGKIYLGSPLGRSIGCKGWNGNSYHIEVEGKYNGVIHDYRTGSGLANWKVSAWAQAEILEWMGWKADGVRIKLHKEGNTSHKACPGVVPKAWIIEQIKAATGPGLIYPGADSASTQAPAPVIPKPRQTLKKGMTGGDVPVLQIKLKSLGRYDGLIDGDFGPKTERGVKLFQASQGLREDGICGPLTWQALEKAVQPPKPAPVSPAPEPPKPAPEPTSRPEQSGYEPGKAQWSETWLFPMMKKVEGKRNLAYPDPPGWSIGYGHCSTSKVPPIPYEGMTCTDEEAEAMLRADLNECLRYINTWVKVPLEPHHVDALCMHIFQQGPTQFRGRLLDTINTSDHAKVAGMIENMEHAKAGVMRRRRLEAARYRGEAPTKW